MPEITTSIIDKTDTIVHEDQSANPEINNDSRNTDSRIKSQSHMLVDSKTEEINNMLVIPCRKHS